ncbi:MAG: fibronectin type III domain-containing protein [Chloroflexota bacterium]|nr:fibronectin type III domain-containing protein [Chloroflexota bacterium]
MRGQKRARLRRWQTALTFPAVIALFGAMMAAWIAVPASAATGFASPAFEAQWRAGEAITPNFWGPLSLARDGQQEQYVEAPGGSRLVQYFDKARMELTNPATGTVTNGLLATELITGKLQSGDNTFETRQPAGVPVAGDPDNIGPTYASISTNAATLLAFTPSAAGSPTTRLLGATGTLGTYAGTYASDPQGTIAAYDSETQHNVPAAFSNYRTKAGLLTIGFAISEPFWSNVKVAGQQKDVLAQAFQRRVLTYTPTNNDPFKVEFGNIGQHYYTWRYQSPQAQITPTPSATTTPTTVADTNAPKLSVVAVPVMTPNSFTVTWQTNEPASSELFYGPSANYEQFNDRLKALFTVDHQVVITGLSPGTTYHYRVQSRDVAGNVTKDDQDRSFTLPMIANVPVITSITVAKTTATWFTVTWTTNVPSKSRIEYAARPDSSDYSRYRPGDTGDPSGTGHNATAISLEANHIYRFRIVSVLNDGTASASDDTAVAYPNNFVQTKAETSALKINGLSASQDKPSRPTTFSFTTDRPASIIIEVGTTNALGGGYFYGSFDDPQGIRDYPFPLTRSVHNVSVNLTIGVTYYYRIYAYDDQGTATSDIKTYTVT